MKAYPIILSLLMIYNVAFSQRPAIQYIRPNNKEGLNIFENSKKDTGSFESLKLSIGGNFTQDYQALNHKNDALDLVVDSVHINTLVPIKDGFNLAMANLNLNAQLADGIRMEITMYLSSRHHAEAWVKGGYIQFDKLTFLNSPFIDKLMKDFTIKIGDYEVDYGDQHYRRTDGGNAIYNPFVENYIMDEFTTEIGGDIIYHPRSGALASFGITNGQLNPTVLIPTKPDPATGKIIKYKAAFHGKMGFDKQFTDDFRLRLTGSFYIDASAENNTLFFGDRAGSHYFFVMENEHATSNGNAWSGRFNPKFTREVSTFMFNPFLQYKSLELFGTFEIGSGKQSTEPDRREVKQYAADIILRFPHKTENFWIGSRINTVNAFVPNSSREIIIKRITGSAGWFMTKNILAKIEYVTQVYQEFLTTDIRSNGKFNGFMIEASVGF
ncbi:MAG: hypothetical protein WBP41_03395 [Saprospiraceae bacterium]